MARRIEFLDTTLRDGNKLPFVVLSFRDRVLLARGLERLGVDIIEAGYPISSTEEVECVEAVCKHVRGPFVSALARALPSDVDQTLDALKSAQKPYLHVFMPTSAQSLARVVKMKEDEALAAVEKSVRRGKQAGVPVQFTLGEASQANRAFRGKLIAAACGAGADVISLADTNGIYTPEDMKEMVAEALAQTPRVGVHCHNDLGLATANSLAAIQAGASHVEVTLGGFGERAGNAALEELAFLVTAYAERYGIAHQIVLGEISSLSRLFDEMTGVHTHPNKPVIGRCALQPKPANGEPTRGLPGNLDTLLQQGSIGAGPEPIREKEDVGARRFQLESFNVMTGSHTPPVGIVVIQAGGSRLVQSSPGSGPIDALFRAVDRALGLSPKLVYYSLFTLSTGPDAPAEVTVTTQLKGRRFHGRHQSTDVIEASLRAYLKACNEMADAGALDGGPEFYVHGEYLWE